MILATDDIKTIVMFLYDDIRWGAGAQIGFNAGDGYSFFSLSVALSTQTVDVDDFTNSEKMGVFVFRVDSMLITFHCIRSMHLSLPLHRSWCGRMQFNN